jgi:LPS O-antigen subunit length determinant protein (WzzB/FepE family)
LATQLGGLATLAGVNLASLQAGQGEEALAVLESRHLIETFVEQHGLKEMLLKDRGPDQQTLWYAVEHFEDAIMTIRTDALRRITTVTVDWRDPAVAADWANGFVALANETLRERALKESERSIEYLNEQIEKTTVVELQRVMYNLAENEMQKLVLANARTEYAFTVVDPAVAPEEKMSPRPALMVSIGLLLGTVFGLILAFIFDARRKRRTARA